MKTNLFVFLFILIMWVPACRQDEGGDGASMTARLQLGWIPSGSFAGEVTGKALFAEAHGLDLTIQPGGPGLNPVVLVQTRQSEFGTLAADEVIAAIERGADLVIVGVINYYSPGGFVSLAERGILTPSDLEGHTVGLLPFGSTTMLYESLLAKNNVNRARVGELAVSPDLRPFLQGAYDVHPVFVYDETVTLDRQGIRYNLIEPKEFGVHYKGPVYFTTRRILRERPELVEAFIRTMADGWNYALANKEAAIRHLKAFAPEIDEERELQVLVKGADYFRGYQGQPINSDEDSFDPMIQEMVRLGTLQRAPDLDRVLQLQFIQDYYAESEAVTALGYP